MSAYFREEVAPMTSEEQVPRGREGGHPGEEDFRDARSLDDVLRIPIRGHFPESTALHRSASYAL